jgi:hypothetical protein
MASYKTSWVIALAIAAKDSPQCSDNMPYVMATALRAQNVSFR